jgi:hypothetical protein
MVRYFAIKWGTPTPVFFAKSAQAHENKQVEIFEERKRA